jgi:hypothetical protein
LSYDKGMRILTATQPDKTATATMAQELGRSLLVQAMEEEAKAHPQEALGDWLRETARRVPVLARGLYPERGDADLQVPELFDFAPGARHSVQGGAR